MRKKLLSILLVLSLMLALVPAAFAADAVRTELESDGTTLAFYGSGVATADCWNGDWTAVTHVDLGYEIRGVAENVLARCVNLVSFEAIGSRYLRTYNGGLISIDGRQMLGAPNRCTAYEILDLVQTVKTGAFRYCQGLTAVTFPASLTTIEAQAFTSCLSLTDVKLPDGLKTIGDFAFAGCAALTSVLIPKSVTSIGAGAFTGCTALTAIDYSGTEAEWAQLTKGENALPEGVTVNFNAPIHHYGSWTGTDPNCTTEGKRTRTCTDDGCGHTEEMTLTARGHYWGIGRVTTMPTETTTGVRTYTFRTYGCNATRTEEIPKLAPRVPVSERFDDVAPNSWAYEDIQYCVDYELMAGVGGGRFDPNGLATREQTAAILYRYARFKGCDLDACGDLSAFADAGSVSAFALAPMTWAVGERLISGNAIGGRTLLDSQGVTTRAQFATIMMRYILNVVQPAPEP